MKILKSQRVAPIYVMPGDTLEVIHSPSTVERLLGWKKKVLLRETIEKPYSVTVVGAFEFEDEFGCAKGIGGYFGEEHGG